MKVAIAVSVLMLWASVAHCAYLYEYRHKSGLAVDNIYTDLAKEFYDEVKFDDLKDEAGVYEFGNFTAKTCEFIEDKFVTDIIENEKKEGEPQTVQIVFTGGKFALFFNFDFRFKDKLEGSEEIKETNGSARIDFHVEELRLETTLGIKDDAPSLKFDVKATFKTPESSDIAIDSESTLIPVIADRINGIIGENLDKHFMPKLKEVKDDYFEFVSTELTSSYNKSVSYEYYGSKITVNRALRNIATTDQYIVYQIDGTVEGVEGDKDAKENKDPTYDETDDGEVRLYYSMPYLMNVISKLAGEGLFKRKIDSSEFGFDGFSFYVGNLFYPFRDLGKKFAPDEAIYADCDSVKGKNLVFTMIEDAQFIIETDIQCQFKLERDNSNVISITASTGFLLGFQLNPTGALDVYTKRVNIGAVSVENVQLDEKQRLVLETLAKELGGQFKNKVDFGSGLPGPRMENSKLIVSKDYLIIYGGAPKQGSGFTN